MIFEHIVIELHCEDCGEETEHLVVFESHVNHKVHYKYFCMDCEEQSAEVGTTYTLFRNTMTFDEWLALYTNYGHQDTDTS